ncbi:MAG: RNA polymerase sigma-70 factor [Marinifilaceae bacterium]|nr:RNA polymerase sigma-70 factor [Marinifilaceae bacterium]
MREKEAKILFEQYYERLVLFAESYVSKTELAEDIVQDVFLDFLSRKDLASIEYTRSYIFSCVKNCCIDYLRKLKITDPLDTKIIDAAYYTGELDILEQEERIQQVEKAIAQLPEQRQAIVKMYFYEGMSYGKIVEITGLSINTVKTHMKKAYQDLRKILVGKIDDTSLILTLLGFLDKKNI